jgi:uncharacterized protein (TIGR02145 family)
MKTKKIIFLTLTFITLFSFGKQSNIQAQNSATTDEGVVINGIRWATRNVDAPGTFAPTPESPGMFYQWNRRKAWNTTDEEVEGWEGWYGLLPTGTKWYVENDPCPEGWRVPTIDELHSLWENRNETETINGVDGRLFGIAPNQIFLPVAGNRNHTNGALNSFMTGDYWSSTQADGVVHARKLNINNYVLNMTTFDMSEVGISIAIRAFGFSIRCVAE